nr:hypothetical protein CPGR_03053 [Mycolicibacterium komanii]
MSEQQEHESGQWNVAAKDNLVYVERANDSGELLFGDSLEPHEARQLARALTKFADKLDESPQTKDREESSDSDSDSEDEDESKDKDSSDEDDDDGDGGDDSDESSS